VRRIGVAGEGHRCLPGTDRAGHIRPGRRMRRRAGLSLGLTKDMIRQLVATMLSVHILAAGLPATTTGAGQVERHLTNVRQLTVGGRNTEAYFSLDGTRVIFQSTHDPVSHTVSGCSQMYVMDLHGDNGRRVSTGYGAATGGYFFPGGRRVLYASTHLTGLHCPPRPPQGDRVRQILHDSELFSVRLDGRELQRLTFSSGYDAEATVAPNGKTIVFTSVRDGDIDLYSMNIDGTGVTRLTDAVGYEGSACYSPDSQRIVYHARHPATADEREAYQTLLSHSLVETGNAEIFTMNADGSGTYQVTANGASNVAPCFHPDGRRILFSSSLSLGLTRDRAKPGRVNSQPAFHLYVVNDDGTGLEQITFEGRVNGFPVMSPDGTMLMWVSDRHAKEPGELNVFLAEWAF